MTYDQTLDLEQDQIDYPQDATYEQCCSSCGGSGQFRSYTGRLVGPCFKCKGRGILTFKTSPEFREKARAYNAAKKEATMQSLWETFQETSPEMATWILAKRGSFDFADSMYVAVCKFGSLTSGQAGAVQKCIAADAARQERMQEQAKTAQARVEAAPVADISKIEAAFAKAHSAIRSPKLRLGVYVFSPAKATSVNAGAVYVKTKGADGTYLGKVMGGKFLASRDCTESQTEEILTAAADPEAAAVAYGRKFGECAICGRELTNGESIERGIGPICAGRFGF